MKSKDWIPAFAESTPRLGQKGSGEGRINYLVVLADAGTHTSWQEWIPAFAGMTKPGGMTRARGNDGRGGNLWALLTLECCVN
jgi:hypothetical protein